MYGRCPSRYLVPCLALPNGCQVVTIFIVFAYSGFLPDSLSASIPKDDIQKRHKGRDSRIVAAEQMRKHLRTPPPLFITILFQSPPSHLPLYLSVPAEKPCREGMILLPSILLLFPSLLLAVPLPLDQESSTYIRGYNYKVSDEAP